MDLVSPLASVGLDAPDGALEDEVVEDGVLEEGAVEVVDAGVSEVSVPLFKCGRSSSESSAGLDEEVEEEVGEDVDEGAVPELGGLPAGGVSLPASLLALELVAAPGRVSRGGPSSGSSPTGADSALSTFVVGSAPAGCHAPVAIHGSGTFTALLCSAVFTVNKPNEFPVRSAS